MSFPRRREMAICGAQKGYIVTLKDKIIILFSDETHGIVNCNNSYKYYPIFTIEDYLLRMSNTIDATLYLESSNKNQWSEQEKSHMENVYLKFNTEKVNKFIVKHIDERYIDTNIVKLINKLLENAKQGSFQKLFDIMVTHDFKGYKELINFALKHLIKKYNVKDGKFVNDVLKVCFTDLVEFYEKHQKELIIQQKQIESKKLNELIDKDILFEFMSSFFMFMVDLTFFIGFNSGTTYHFGFFGSQHVINILKVFELQDGAISEIISDGDCLSVDKINKLY